MLHDTTNIAYKRAAELTCRDSTGTAYIEYSGLNIYFST